MTEQTPVEQAHSIALQLRGELFALPDRLSVLDRDDMAEKRRELAGVTSNLCERLRVAVEAQSTTEDK